MPCPGLCGGAMNGVATRVGGRLARRPATPLRLVLALTFATGVVHVVGYLRLDQVFVGNVTGNVVILGMPTVRGTGLSVLGPTGLAADSRLGAARRQGALRRSAAVALIVVGAVAGAALCQVHEGLAVAAAAFVVLVVSGLGHAVATTSSTSPPTGSSATAPSMACVVGGVPRTADTSRAPR